MLCLEKIWSQGQKLVVFRYGENSSFILTPLCSVSYHRKVLKDQVQEDKADSMYMHVYMCTCVCVYYSACVNLHSLNLMGQWGWADKLSLVFLCSSPYGEEHPGLVRFGFVFQCKMFLVEVFSTSAAHQQWFSFPVLGSDPWHPCGGA